MSGLMCYIICIFSGTFCLIQNYSKDILLNEESTSTVLCTTLYLGFKYRIQLIPCVQISVNQVTGYTERTQLFCGHNCVPLWALAQCTCAAANSAKMTAMKANCQLCSAAASSPLPSYLCQSQWVIFTELSVSLNGS